MKSEVYFLPVDRLNDFDRVIPETGIFEHFIQNTRVALKLHFGSMHHNNTIPPKYISTIIKMLNQKGSSSFLTDTNVLYKDDRARTDTHLKVISKNKYDKLGVPILIAGEDKEENYIPVKSKSKYYKEFFIAKEYTELKSMIALTHFKGHGFAAIGGSIKNLAMGCASRKGKFAMHANIVPDIKTEKCIGCGVCAENCPAQAISLINRIATIKPKKCIGCAQCIRSCPEGAIKIPWTSVSPQEFQEKLSEYANCARSFFGDHFFCINFLINITPFCDCETNPGEKLLPDIGVLFSKDPVAIDRACVNMIKETETPEIPKGVEKFSYIRPGNHPDFQLNYAEELGLGSNNYKIIYL